MSAPRFDEVRIAITSHFATGFVSAPGVPWCPVQYDNQKFSASDDVDFWARFSIQEGDTQNASVGPDFQRTLGIVWLQCFTREGHGTKRAAEAATILAALFNNVSLAHTWGDILFRVASMKRIGTTKEGWHQTNLWVPYQVDLFTREEATQPHVFDAGDAHVTDTGAAIVLNP